MKAITLPTARLRHALTGLSKVIAKHPSQPELAGIRIRRHENGQVDLTVSDLDHTASYLLDSQDHPHPLALLVPFEDLSNVIKSCRQADFITVEALNQEAASIRFLVGGQSMEHHCKILPLEKFPEVAGTLNCGVSIPDTLRKSIHEALDCASSDRTRIMLNGAFLDVRSEGAHYVVGTDGRHLFSANSFVLPLTESVLIPGHKFLAWKGFNEDGPWNLRTQAGDDKQGPLVELCSPHWRFFTRTFEGRYPDWKAVLPSASAYGIVISLTDADVQHMLQAIQQLPIHDEKHQTIGLELISGSLNLVGKSPADQAWTKMAICEVKAEQSFVVHLDRRFLDKALRFGLNQMGIIDELSPIKFSHGGRQMVIMPLRPGLTPAAASVTPPASPTPGKCASSHPTDIINPPPPMPDPSHDIIIPETPRQVSAREIAATRPILTGTHSQGEPKPPLEQALVQIEALKANFRDAISGLTKLGDIIRGALREQKASDKDLQTVRQTLRSLQGVRI